MPTDTEFGPGASALKPTATDLVPALEVYPIPTAPSCMATALRPTTTDCTFVALAPAPITTVSSTFASAVEPTATEF